MSAAPQQRQQTAPPPGGEQFTRQEIQHEIEQALALLVAPGSAFEVRILGALKNKSAICSGYFDDTGKAAAAILRYDGKAKGVYVTLNPVEGDLLARAYNRIEEWAKDTTKDEHITQRRWLLIDCDPVRPSGISSSEAERSAASERAAGVRDWLHARGWCAPVEADSGNGMHLLYHIDLPNNAESETLVNKVLKALHQRFSDDTVGIDTTVSNASRISKVYGTMTRKGDNVPGRPHRRACLVVVPEHQDIVSREQLEELAATLDNTTSSGVQSDTAHDASTHDASTREQRYIRAGVENTLKRAVYAVQQAPDGSKHKELRNRARLCGGYVHYGIISEQDIERALYDAIEGRAENTTTARKTIQDGIAHGKQSNLYIDVPERQHGHEEPEEPPESVEELLTSVPEGEDATREAVHAAALKMIEQAARLPRGARIRIAEELRARGANTTFVREWTGAVSEKEKEQRRARRTSANGGSGSGGSQHQQQQAPDLLTLAELWSEANSERYAYNVSEERWYRWVGTHWQRLYPAEPTLIGEMAAFVREQGYIVSSRRRAADCLDYARQFCQRELLRRGSNTLVNFRNGTLDASTGELFKHRRTDKMTYCLPYEWAPGGEYPNILHFLEQTIPDEIARAAYLAHLGLALLGDKGLHYSILLIGPPRSGKSTLLQLANALCGYSTDTYASAAIFSRQTEGLRARARWNGRLLCCLDELPVEALQDEETFKTMAAHGGAPARAMNVLEEQENVWTAKLLFTTNEQPRYTDRSGALTERLLTIECPNTRQKSQRDAKLLARLLPELQALVPICLELAQLVQEHGYYPESSTMQNSRDEIEHQADNVKQFVRDCCRMAEKATVGSNTLHTAYVQWCEEQGIQIRYRKTLDNLSSAIEARYPASVKRVKVTENGKQVRGVRGIGLVSGDEPPPDGTTDTSSHVVQVVQHHDSLNRQAVLLASGAAMRNARQVVQVVQPPANEHHGTNPPPHSPTEAQDACVEKITLMEDENCAEPVLPVLQSKDSAPPSEIELVQVEDDCCTTPVLPVLSDSSTVLELPHEPKVLAELVRKALAPPPDFDAAYQIAAYALNGQREALLREIKGVQDAAYNGTLSIWGNEHEGFFVCVSEEGEQYLAYTHDAYRTYEEAARARAALRAAALPADDAPEQAPSVSEEAEPPVAGLDDVVPTDATSSDILHAPVQSSSRVLSRSKGEYVTVHLDTPDASTDAAAVESLLNDSGIPAGWRWDNSHPYTLVHTDSGQSTAMDVNKERVIVEGLSIALQWQLKRASAAYETYQQQRVRAEE